MHTDDSGDDTDDPYTWLSPEELLRRNAVRHHQHIRDLESMQEQYVRRRNNRRQPVDSKMDEEIPLQLINDISRRRQPHRNVTIDSMLLLKIAIGKLCDLFIVRNFISDDIVLSIVPNLTNLANVEEILPTVFHPIAVAYLLHENGNQLDEYNTIIKMHLTPNLGFDYKICQFEVQRDVRDMLDNNVNHILFTLVQRGHTNILKMLVENAESVDVNEIELVQVSRRSPQQQAICSLFEFWNRSYTILDSSDPLSIFADIAWQYHKQDQLVTYNADILQFMSTTHIVEQYQFRNATPVERKWLQVFEKIYNKHTEETWVHGGHMELMQVSNTMIPDPPSMLYQVVCLLLWYWDQVYDVCTIRKICHSIDNAERLLPPVLWITARRYHDGGRIYRYRDDVKLFLSGWGMDLNVLDFTIMAPLKRGVRQLLASLMNDREYTRDFDIGMSFEEAEQRIPQRLASSALYYNSLNRLYEYNTLVKHHLFGLGVDVKTCQFRMITPHEHRDRIRVLNEVVATYDECMNEAVHDAPKLLRLKNRLHRYQTGNLQLIQVKESLIPASTSLRLSDVSVIT
jgi:hypothetical protein